MSKAPIEHQIQTPYGEICWFEWGRAGEGPTLLLLHATGFHARLWDQVIAHLPDDLHVVAPDQLGHGRSYKPDSMAEWTTSCRALLPLIDHLTLAGQPLLAAGHSMGGYVLSLLAAERPEAFDQILLIDPVILDPEAYLGGAHIVPDPMDHPVAKRRNIWPSAQDMAARFADRPPYDTWDRAVVDDYCQYGLLPRADGDGLELACPPKLEASIYQNAPAANPYDWADKVKARTHIWRAPQSPRASVMDFRNSPTWLGAAEAFGAETDRLWPDHSHFMPMEAPKLVAQAMAALFDLDGAKAG